MRNKDERINPPQTINICQHQDGPVGLQRNLPKCTSILEDDTSSTRVEKKPGSGVELKYLARNRALRLCRDCSVTKFYNLSITLTNLIRSCSCKAKRDAPWSYFEVFC